MRNTTLYRAAVLFAALLAAPAFAGSATVEGGSGRDRHQVVFEYSGDRLRMQPQAQAEGTMILRDGRVYMIASGMVFEFADMMKMMGSVGSQAPGIGPDDAHRVLGLDATGRTEKVAGLSGTVHVLRYADAQGREHREEIVLSRDAQARELATAMDGLSRAMMRALGKTETPAEAQLWSQLKGQGVLRYGSEFRVVSFGGQPAASRFELPSAPQKLPSLGALGGASPSGEAAASDGGGVLGQIFGQKAQRQQDRVEQRSESEVDRATDEAVDNVLNKAFDKLFNR